jgi:hypothetical protein
MTLVTFLGDVWMPAVVRHATREFAMLQCRGCGGRFARRRVWQAAQCRGGLWPPSKQPLRVYRVIMFLNFIVYYSFLYLNLIGRLTNIVPTDIYERSWRELKKRLLFFLIYLISIDELINNGPVWFAQTIGGICNRAATERLKATWANLSIDSSWSI